MDQVDHFELAKFAAMASEWWDPSGTARPLHDLNPTRLQFISDRCDLKHKKVLDIGCGGGILSESLAKRGAIVTGIDAEETVIRVAKDHAAQHRLPHLTYLHTTAEVYATLYPETFDVITCMELLEHVPIPDQLIQSCQKLLKPGGQLFFSTLNRTLKSYLLAVVSAEYILKLLPKGTHHYDKFIRPFELQQWLMQANLTVKELAGISYNPFARTASLTKDVSVNYLLYATK